MRRRYWQRKPLILERLEDRTTPAAVPLAILGPVPAETLLGENFSFNVGFDNTSPADIGYGPYVDLYLPATGADGAGAAVDDGITFVSATYLGAAVQATTITLTSAGVPHPFAKGANGQPLIILPPAGFRAGDQLVVLQVPYGSFTPAQPQVNLNVTTKLSNLADVNTVLPIAAQGGFRFGNDPLDNPAGDPTITGPTATANTTPTLFRLTKTYLGTESETATGPNFPRSYQISVDIADGQTITNLDLTDKLPPELQFISVTSTSPAATITSTPSTSPGGTLTANFASVTGTTGAIDAQMTFSFYVPLLNATGGVILDPLTGNDATAVDDASAQGNWTPLDPRDNPTTVVSDVTANDHTLTLMSIATQKTSSIVNDVGAPGLSPGDTVEYTLNFQVSDYFAFQNVQFSDLFSDGQEFVPGSATLDVTDDHSPISPTSGAFAPANFTLDRNFSGGSDRLIFLVSQELAARVFSPNGQLVGGAIPDGGTGGPPPQSAPPLPFGPTFGTVTFRTIVRDNYEIDFPSGDPALNQGDPISNAVTISGDLLDVSNLTPNGQSESDTSSSQNQITTGSFVKSVYAVNGQPAGSGTPLISPGDTVTYRLRYSLPSGDVENLKFTDFPPLPIFDVDTTAKITGFDAVVSGTAPPPVARSSARTIRSLPAPASSPRSVSTRLRTASPSHTEPTTIR